MGKWLISCLHTDKMFCACLDGMARDNWPSNKIEKDIQNYYDIYRFSRGVVFSNGIHFTNNRAMLVTDAKNVKEATEIFFKSWSSVDNCEHHIEPNNEIAFNNILERNNCIMKPEKEIRVCDLCGEYYPVVVEDPDYKMTYLNKPIDICNNCYSSLLNLINDKKKPTPKPTFRTEATSRTNDSSFF